MSGFPGIGPGLRPFRSYSQLAKELEKARVVFYSENTDASKVPCPFTPGNPIGNSVAVSVVHSIVPCEDGRIKGAIQTGDNHIKYELACNAHLSPEKRIPLARVHSYSKSPAGDREITCFYCNHPDHIDPSYVPPESVQVKTPSTPPIIV